jgi:hypothetical protein
MMDEEGIPSNRTTKKTAIEINNDLSWKDAKSEKSEEGSRGLIPETMASVPKVKLMRRNGRAV